MVNYPIYSPHLDLSKDCVSPVTIKPSDIKSMHQDFRITESSWPRNLEMPPMPYLVKGPDGEIYGLRRTSGNTFIATDIAKYGDFSPQIDDVQGFGSWDDTGKKPQTREYVKLPEKSVLYGIIESFRERPLKLTEGDTPVKVYVHDTWYAGRINESGRYSHLVRNLKQHLMEYYGLKSSQELVDLLSSKGLTLEEIGYLAIGFIPGIYGVGRARDGKVIFFAGEDSHNQILEEARLSGLDVKKLRAMGFDEEQTHIARRSYDKGGTLEEVIAEEKATKRMLQESYLDRAKGAQGNPELVREYLIKAAIMEGDIQTTRERYYRAWKEHRGKLEEALEKFEEPHSSEESEASSYQTASTNNKVIRMPNRASRTEKREYKGDKAKVVYAKFGKGKYKGRENKGREGNEDEGREYKGRQSSSKAGDESGAKDGASESAKAA